MLRQIQVHESGCSWDLSSATLGESRLDEADFTAQHVGGFAAHFRLVGHQIEKCLPFDVHDFCVGNVQPRLDYTGAR